MEIIQRYSKIARAVHWAHAAAFIVLVVTGIFLFVPAAGILAQGSWSRIVHRAAAMLFIAAPLIQVLVHPGTTKEAIKQAFTWDAEDLEWIQAAPRYYFLSDESTVPETDSINPIQKVWLIILLVMVPVFVITGILMWFFAYFLPSAVFQWCVFIHDVAFITTFIFMLVHIYLGTIHPVVQTHGGSFRAMTKGSITAAYAKSHYGKQAEKRIENE
jgi:formate dehydrogenase subunit gamma